MLKRSAILAVSCLLMALVLGTLAAQQAHGTTTDEAGTQFRMPLVFTKNVGQWDDRVLFRTEAGGATIWFTKESVTYQFTRRVERSGTRTEPISSSASPASHSGEGRNPASLSADPRARFNHELDSTEQLVISARFVGASPNFRIIGEGLMEYKCNYFIGNDPAQWHTDVPNYEAITFEDIYPGIDLRYSSDDNSQVACKIIADPVADLSKLKVEYQGVEGTFLDTEGRVILRTIWGEIVTTPESGPGLISSRSFARSTDTLTSATSGQLNPSLGSGSLLLTYGTFLGGAGDDYGYGIAIDSGGNAYVAGNTNTADFPTQIPYSTYQSGWDIFVTKLSNLGSSLIFSTYFGGDSHDFAWDLAADNSGDVYVTGYTYSANLPTMNPFQLYQGESDAYVTKISKFGNSIIYSTYLGGTKGEIAYSIAVDKNRNALVTGATGSASFPTLNSLQSYRSGDAFVTKLSSSGNSLIYSTFLGGGWWEHGRGITVDSGGNAYVVGSTISDDFPTKNPYMTYFGNTDVFVSKISEFGDSLIYSTYLGGGEEDNGQSIAVDDSGDAYISGSTRSGNFPTKNAYQSYRGGDAFVTRLASSGNVLVYSTFLGGEMFEGASDIVVDSNHNAYVTGYTPSQSFPTRNPYQVDGVGWDAFVTKFSSSGNSLHYSTYLGGSSDEGSQNTYDGSAMVIDGNGSIYVIGHTASLDFPTHNPIQGTYGGGAHDVFAVKFSELTYQCGDTDTDGIVSLLDAVLLVDYVFSGGAAPSVIFAGDVDCSTFVNISDAVYLINYVFSGGAAPCAACP